MFNAYSIGFVCVAATALAGVDYYTQSTKGGYGFGQMPISAYFSSFPDRMAQASAEKAAEQAERERKSAWNLGAQPFLPEAPQGWTRRALTEGDNSAVMPYVAESENQSAGASLLDTMNAREQRAEDRKRAERSWVYENGSESIFVEIKLLERPSNNSVIGLVASTINGLSFQFGESEKGYAVIGGVGYVEQFNSDGQRPHHFRVLNATLGFGHEAQILVHANASSESTREILDNIDYDGLNALLPQPVAHVSNEFTLAEGLDEVSVSKQLQKLRAEFLQLRATEAQHRMANLNTTALIANTYAQGYGAGDGLLDITGGKEMSLDVLIDMSFHTAAAAVMEGKSAAEISADVGKLVKAAVSISDAEVAARAAANTEAAPTMSPELARELSGYSDASADEAADNTATAQNTVQVPDAIGGADSPGAVLMQIDQTASGANEDMIYSMALDPTELQIFMDERGSSAGEMRLGFTLAARMFEGEHGLTENSCRYVSDTLRLECKATQADDAPSGLASLLQRWTGGGDDAAEEDATATRNTNTTPQVQPQSQPTRLQLSNGSNSGGNCVGSFCN